MKGDGKEVEVTVQTEEVVSNKDLAYIDNKVKCCLSMDTDLSSLYRLVRNELGFEWISTQKAGRLLRSPTVFEDLVKTICTTNCTWKQTRNMVRRLCGLLGRKFEEVSTLFQSHRR